MSVALADPHAWKTPGCGSTCQAYRVRFPLQRFDQWIAYHDPSVHEAYGRRLTMGQIPDLGNVVTVGPLTINPRTYEVSVGGHGIHGIHLTPTERRILVYLAANAGRVCSAEEISEHVWSHHAGAHVLGVNVSRLRGKLREARSLLQTVRNAGYVLSERRLLGVLP